MSKVLILYGTRFGATEGIALEIEKIIKEKGIITETHNLKTITSKDISSLKDYDGIIIGTSIKMSLWTKPAKKFIKKNLAELKRLQDKLGFFICCGTANKKEEISSAKNKFITPKLEKLGLKPALIDAFGGVYDLRDESLMGGMNKKIIAAALKEEEGWEVVENKIYDYRDWNQVRDFSQKFSSIIKH